MVLVTDIQYYLDPRLKEKLDLMIHRMKSGKDNLVLIDGDEGDGKTNMSFLVAYYVAHTCNREFGLKNVFFDLDELIEFAIHTKKQVIVWDEGALGGLASEWWNKNQKKFIKLMMIARKKQHFWLVNIPKFFKLNEYFVIDRSIGLIHVYMHNETSHGYFVYFNQRQKEKLWEDWKKTRVRGYKKWWNFHGRFVLFLENDRFKHVINPVEYDKKKDNAIMSIAQEPEKKENRTDMLMRDQYVQLLLKLNPNITRKELAKKIGTTGEIIRRCFERINSAKEGLGEGGGVNNKFS